MRDLIILKLLTILEFDIPSEMLASLNHTKKIHSYVNYEILVGTELEI